LALFSALYPDAAANADDVVIAHHHPVHHVNTDRRSSS
jgi:hypothetical protein